MRGWESAAGVCGGVDWEAEKARQKRLLQGALTTGRSASAKKVLKKAKAAVKGGMFNKKDKGGGKALYEAAQLEMPEPAGSRTARWRRARRSESPWTGCSQNRTRRR